MDTRESSSVGGQLVTMTEVAELAGVRRPTVSNWRRRHDDFPEPARDDGQQPLFDAETVAAWLDRRPLPTREQEPGNEAWTYGDRLRDGLRLRALASLRGVLSGDRLVAAGLTLTALRTVSGRPLRDAASATRLAETTENERPHLAGVFTTDLAGLPVHADLLVSTVDELYGALGSGSAAERLIAEADRLGSGLRSTATPDPIADLVATLSATTSRDVVYDPAAGSGTLLLASLQGVRAERVAACDIDPYMLRMLRCRLLCHGVQAETACGDSLNRPTDLRPDLLVLDPPFTASDPPSPGRANTAYGPLAWARHAAEHLAEGGSAYVVTPRWTLDRPGAEDAIRAQRRPLFDHGLVRAIVQLPPRIHTYRTGTELALLVLGRPTAPEMDAGQRPSGSSVVLCDASRVRAANDAEWQDNVVRLLDDPGDVEKDAEASAACSVPATALAGSPSVLPAHWVAAETKPVEYVSRLHNCERALACLDETESAKPEALRMPIVGASPARRRVRVGEHLQAKRLLALPGHRIAPDDVGDDGAALIGADEMLGKRPLGSRRIDKFALRKYEAARYTERGDVLVLNTGDVRTWVDTEGLSVPLSPVQVLRIPGYTGETEEARPDAWISPLVLATLLTAARNRSRQTGSLVRRASLASLELPELTKVETRKLDRILQNLEQRRRRAEEELSTLSDLRETLAGGFADGALSIDAGELEPVRAE